MSKNTNNPGGLNKKLKFGLAWGAMLALLSASVFVVEQNATNFQASIIPSKTAPAYDGLTMPIKKAPDWVNLSTEEWKMNYNTMPANKLVTIPKYDPNQLRVSTDSLVWGNAADNQVRNAKITYSVAYMGNYKLDGKEYAGSHLAVDIKIPEGTPVYAIGNGIVNKTSEQLYGFGKHIVIEHKNFPSYDNPAAKTTLFSSYSHLSAVSIKEGDVVGKGDLIGYSGTTGSSTTPHLHFQIDNSSAPWHPYWPFTSQEAAAAGLNFTSAINSGLNQNIAIANTVNPVMYVQKYSTGSTGSTSQNTTTNTNTNTATNTTTTNTTTTNTTNTNTSTSNTTVTPEDTTTTTDTTTEVTTTSTATPAPEDPNETKVVLANPENEYVTFKILADETFEPGDLKQIKIKAVNRAGDTVTNYNPAAPIRIDMLKGDATIEPRKLRERDFVNGTATIEMQTKNSAPVQFIVKSDNVMVQSPTFAPGVFLDIASTHPHFEAISFLKGEGVIAGYPDGRFKPDNVVSRVETLKFILEGIQEDILPADKLSFNDTKSSEWYADYIYTAQKLGVAKGYPDGSFKPGADVNKVEFLKMLLTATDAELTEGVTTKDFRFRDIEKNAWYLPYIKYALDKNIIEADGTSFNPTQEIKREEVAEAMYRIKILQMTSAERYSEDLSSKLSDL